MASTLGMLCPGSRPAHGALGRQIQQQFRHSSRRMGAALSCAVLFTFIYYTPFSAVAAVETVSAKCESGESETTCTCSEGANGDAADVTTLSQKQNVLKLDCQASLKCAPENLGNKVCEAKAEEFTNCNVELCNLLAGKPPVSWTPVPEKRNNQGESKSLTVPPQNFPFVDEQFAVGCKASDNGKKCTFTVTLAARPTARDGQTVTCAYGASSNQSHQKIKLNPTQNSFTLVCGEKGKVLPTRYEEGFCSSGLKGDEESCEGSYTSVLPGYEAKWWSKHDADNSYTLSIPNDKFPAEEAKLVVGCRQKPSSDPAKGATAAAVSSTVCNVDVTIEASSSASLSSRREDVFGLLAGAAVMTVFAHRV
ncbi:SAG-related sequence [Besnoitia besnoiti]|uniref:SAG-related sequence n=1 Tax=Besnoitia besnoiti TaxID=94643 RepID=A0A2A9MFW0_BESBE|nr:SAG-related sequence [Besnoitia besnoiti]PFH36074.1 SAG-related sequence [Besnoitia besnoiti]